MFQNDTKELIVEQTDEKFNFYILYYFDKIFNELVR